MKPVIVGHRGVAGTYPENTRVSFEAAAKLGGTKVQSQAGKHVWRFKVLPKIPLQIVFYEADDDFPAEIQIMLDQTALQFMEFECLAFMVGCVARALIKTSQFGDVVGWDK